MAFLLFMGLYAYSYYKIQPNYQHLIHQQVEYEGHSEIRLAWRMGALFFYEPWLISLQKKGYLLDLNENCRRARLDGAMSSRQCAVALLIFYTLVLSSGLEAVVLLLCGYWNICIFGACLIGGSIMGVRAVEAFFLKVKRIRHRQISQQLPVFLTKLMLNMGAGVNIKDAWVKSLEESQSGYFQKYGWCVLRDFEVSGSLRVALEQMGLQMSDYRVDRLVKLLVQMRDYGDAGFMGKLEAMKLELWQDRLRAAKEMAEEAKIKLLLPLFMILGGIMLAIMVPILMAMKGVFL